MRDSAEYRAADLLRQEIRERRDEEADKRNAGVRGASGANTGAVSVGSCSESAWRVQEALERLAEGVRRVVHEVVERVPERRLTEHLERRARHPAVDVDDIAPWGARGAVLQGLADLESGQNAVSDRAEGRK